MIAADLSEPAQKGQEMTKEKLTNEERGKIFQRGVAYGERMMAIFDRGIESSPRRSAFTSGVYYAVFKREKQKGPSRSPQPTPTTKLMINKHRALIEALTENSELKRKIEILEGQKRVIGKLSEK